MYASADDGLTQNADLGSEDQASDRSSASDTSSNVATRPLRRSDRIAKDTGCCLYSAISALVTMLAILGIVLVLTGPTRGLSLLPPLKSLTGSSEHNRLDYNRSQVANNWTSVDYPEENSEAEILPSETDYDEYYSYDYHNDNSTVWRTANGSTPAMVWINGTDANATLEDLEQLQPEAYMGGRSRGYVAYVPIPINSDDDDDEDDEDDEEEETPRRRRPELRRQPNRKPMVLPMMVVPSSGIRTNSQYARERPDTNRFYDQAEYVVGNRRFDEFQPDDSDADHPDTERASRPRPLPAPVPRPPMRNFQPRPVSGIDYRMFGTLAYENRNRFRDDPRIRNIPERRPESSRQRPLVMRPSGYRPSRPYRRPGPSSGEREYREQRFQGRRIHPRYQERVPAYNPHPPALYVKESTAPSSRKPLDYEYPRDAMNIQDIIGYMTSIGHADQYHESSNQPNRNYYNQYRNSAQRNSNRPATSNLHTYRGLDSATKTTRTKPPYSFMLDVYPMKDRPQTANGGTFRNNHYESGQRYVNSGPHYVLQGSEDRRYPSANRDDIHDLYVNDEHRTYNSNKNLYHEQHEDEDEEELPLVPNKGIIAKTPYGDPPATSSNKKQQSKVVVHLNVFNSKNGDTRVEAEDRSDHDEYFSPSDIYRAVLRNNAAKRDQQGSHDLTDVKSGHNDDSLPGGESRVFVTHKISSEIGDDGTDDVHLSYKNHKMSQVVDEYRTSPSSRPRYRTTYAHDEDEIESLPIPMAQQLNVTQNTAPVESNNKTAGLFQRILG